MICKDSSGKDKTPDVNGNAEGDGDDDSDDEEQGSKKQPAQLNIFAEPTEGEDAEAAWKEKTVKRGPWLAASVLSCRFSRCVRLSLPA